MNLPFLLAGTLPLSTTERVRNGPFSSFSTGRPAHPETTMLRRSAAAAPAQPCIPGTVVRLAIRATARVAADDPRVSTRAVARMALVNGPGPECEVRR
jgi:hypothetical protein